MNKKFSKVLFIAIGAAAGAAYYFMTKTRTEDKPVEGKSEAAKEAKTGPRCIGECYKAELEGTDAQGLEFAIGDSFKVLEINGENLLIEKLGDANNPYTVAKDFLMGISTLSREDF